MIRILGRVTSINVRKVLWLADAMGLNYEREDWGQPLRDPKVPEFLALNPNGQVPVLIEDDLVLWESGAILTHLARRHGPTPLWPEDERERALTEQRLGWQGTELAAVWGYAVMALARKLPGYDDKDRAAAALKRWTAKMEILEGQLARTGAYAVGERMTLADIALGLSVHRWFAMDEPPVAMPAAEAYLMRLRADPAGSRHLTAATP